MTTWDRSSLVWILPIVWEVLGSISHCGTNIFFFFISIRIFFFKNTKFWFLRNRKKDKNKLGIYFLFYLLCMCKFTSYYLLKRFQDDLKKNMGQNCFRSWDKSSIFSLFQSRLYDVTEASIIIWFSWNYIYFVENVCTGHIRTKFMHLYSLYTRYGRKRIITHEIWQELVLFPVYARLLQKKTPKNNDS